MSTTTPDFTFEMQARQFAALVRPVLPHISASRNEMPVLRAVRLTSAPGYIIATTTDRYTLGVQRLAVPDTDTGLRATVPLDAVKRILTIFKGTRHDDPVLRFEHSDDTLTVGTAGGLGDMVGATVKFSCVPGPYPTLRSNAEQAFTTAPSSKPCKLLALNPTMLARFAAAQTNGEPVLLQVNGAMAPVGVTVGDDFIGLIQPMRPQTGAADREVWTDLLETKPEEKAA